jgi:RIO kinase 1
VGEEYATLRLLHAAGAAVPRPLARAGQAILMEYVGDAEVPAPPLYRVELTAEEARPPFARLMGEIALWLARRRVHGDRSAYNLLYWQGRLTAIDFPQAADPRANPHADALLARDVDNVRRCVARYGVAADAGRLAADLWRRFLLAAR